MADLEKVMGVEVGDIEKIMGIGAGDTEALQGFGIPSGPAWQGARGYFKEGHHIQVQGLIGHMLLTK